MHMSEKSKQTPFAANILKMHTFMLMHTKALLYADEWKSTPLC